ncbi:SEP-domain-containing protein [Trametopsis cervina]|nr:SEP-domain-containing protein [Trametopsis cervina]
MSDHSNSPSPRPWSLPSNTGPRIGRIGGAGWGNSGGSSGNSGSGRRIATLGDVAGSSDPHAGHGHGPGDEDDGDEGDDPQEFFAGGGERSGVSIQGPPGRGGGANVPGGDLVRDLLQRAAAAGPPPAPPTASSGSRYFGGGGHRLGGEDVETEYIPDPSVVPQNPDELPTAIRRLTFWRNGFNIEDGELMHYDDPVHAAILEEINTGRAPPAILNVQTGQQVELRVAKRTHEDYVPSVSAASARVFAGTGNRLGSPVPTVVSRSPMPGDFPSSSAAPSSTAGADRESVSTIFEVDKSKPTVSVQLRMADGGRSVWRANLHHTVGDLRRYINASSPENGSRPYTLQTTFPTKVLDDDSKTVQEVGIGGAVVLQRWV